MKKPDKVFNTNSILLIIAIIAIVGGILFLYKVLQQPPAIGADQLLTSKQEKKILQDSIRMKDKVISILKESLKTQSLQYSEELRSADSAHVVTINSIVALKAVKAETKIKLQEFVKLPPNERASYILNSVKKQ